MPTLRDIQRAVRRSVLEREDGEAASHIIADGLTPAERLSVYRNTVVSALTGALRLSYPAVHRLVGAEFFDGAAQTFIQERPPRSACLDDYGAAFSDFLERFSPAASLPYLPDVARLEWAVNRALHAADVKPLDMEHFVEPESVDHGRIRFAPHPSVSLIRANSPADVIWRSVLEQDDAAMAAIDLADGPAWLMVERSATGIEVRRMTEAAWRFTAELCAGQPLQAAIDAAPEVEAATLLADHLATGRFIGFSLNGSATILQPLDSVV